MLQAFTPHSVPTSMNAWKLLLAQNVSNVTKGLTYFFLHNIPMAYFLLYLILNNELLA